ncbi:hypothetical protein LUZ60_008483 [Juncus effusus]|nr:hypothetical protein LUZ60_008483 [Juncus effusus]
MGPSTLRYPSDRYDRIWHTHDPTSDWNTISTTKQISNYNNDDFEAPSVALQFAATPTTGSQLNFSWGDGNTSTEYFSVFYFSEVVDFTVVNGHNFTLQATPNSTLPPIINAMEIYTRLVPTQTMTDQTDVEAMNGIKKDYGVRKNWMGDPCSPVQYAWDGLKCSYGTDGTKIIKIDLSNGKLGGGISSSFASLQSVQFLDLSYNNLFGTIPDFLGNMTSLQVLNLTGNNFVGPVPDSLQQKINSGLLILVNDSNKKSCGAISCSTRTLIIIIVVPSFVLIILILVIIWLILCRKSSEGGILSANVSMQPLRMESLPRPSNSGPTQNMQNVNLDFATENLNFEGRKFSYIQLESLTNKFTREIGKGGFGVVYYGKLENGTEIAVKMSSDSSVQGKNEFFAEVNSLTKVHHKNLVSLIGYCTDGRHRALVLEYMPMGSFKDHLTGRTGIARVLTWRQRLQIAFEAAKGLDYLHTGCEIIHRDVKSSNILLGPNLEAKLSDFGLCKFCNQSEQGSFNSIGIVGTPGYIDPESSKTIRLTYKSDVYSFGVILLEMLTGEPATTNYNEGSHIANRVASRLSRGDINEIMDAKLNGQFNPKSAWKVVDLAMRCVAVSSLNRPRMDEMVLCLRECVDLEGLVESNNERSERNGVGSSNVKTVKFAS